MTLELSSSHASRQLAGVIAVFSPDITVHFTDSSDAPKFTGHEETTAIALAQKVTGEATAVGGTAAQQALLDVDPREAVGTLNTFLAKSTFITSPKDLSPSLLDALLFGHVHPVVATQTAEQRSETNHVTRWFLHLQTISKRPVAALPVIEIQQDYIPPKKDTKPAATAAAGGGKGGRQPAAKKVEASDAAKAKLIVGKMLSVEKHPTADTLYVEKIDLGEGEPRTIVSGLVNFYSAEQLLNRLVVVVANLPVADLKGVVSAGLVLCASDADKTVVEVLDPPAGSQVGERVQIVGEEWADEGELNKKVFQRFLKPLQTNADKVACWKDKVLQTSAGPITVPTLAKAAIK